MAEKDPRKMALQIAGLRANETHLPEEERVFQDPYAEYFFSPELRESVRDPDWVRGERAKYEQIMPGVNGAIVARTKLFDEYLRSALGEGFQQAVIIGAGYDTRAYRIDGVEHALTVFEIDHPVTQQVKIDTIKEIFGGLPDHVRYVPVVFGEDRLDKKLLENGFRSGEKTLYIAEGVLMYIPPPAVDALLGFITQTSAPGSAFMADYFDTTVVQGESTLKEARVLKQFVESEGAPLQFGIDQGHEYDFFRERGFDQVTIVTPAQCKEKYFKGLSSHRAVSPMFNFVFARTASR